MVCLFISFSAVLLGWGAALGLLKMEQLNSLELSFLSLVDEKLTLEACISLLEIL